MAIKYLLAVLAWCLLPAALVRAHFVWIDVQPGADGKPTAQVWFSETPGPGEPHLIRKISQTQAWVRLPTGTAMPLSLQVPVDEQVAALSAPFPFAGASSLEAICDYGVFRRGDKAMYLHYYAKHLGKLDEASWPQLSRAEKLPLDLVPRQTSTALILAPSWSGKPPAKDIEVTVYLGDSDEPKKLTPDSQGQFKIEPAPRGKIAARARLLLADRNGEHQGQAYSGELYYCTLTMNLSPSSTSAQLTPAEQTGAGPAAANEELPAPELLARARAARATWHEFPGFRARLDVQLRGYQGAGSITVAPDGDVNLAGFPEGLDEKRVKGYLESLVQHRLAETGADDKVEYVTESQSHPLGRLIKFVGDEKLHSTYRVRGDLITEVNRVMGDLRFTIDVLDAHRDAAGKYLPQTFTVGYWDSASGALRRSETHVNLWTAVGRFELPRAVRLAQSSSEGSSVMELSFTAHELLPPAASEK